MNASFALENKKVKQYAIDESKLFIQVIGTVENGERITLALPAHLEASGLVLTP